MKIYPVLLAACFALTSPAAHAYDVPVQRTPVSTADAANAIAEAWAARVGGRIPVRTLAILTAQWDHETAHGRRVYGYNFAGIKGTGPSGMSMYLVTAEGKGRTRRTLRQRFRAYRNLEEGAYDYIDILIRDFGRAWVAAYVGDVDGFVRELYRAQYFTGSYYGYRRSLRETVSEYLEQWGPDPEIVTTT